MFIPGGVETVDYFLIQHLFLFSALLAVAAIICVVVFTELLWITTIAIRTQAIHIRVRLARFLR